MSHTFAIALAGGGTGGHAIPLQSIHDYLTLRGKYRFVWIGSLSSLEKRLASESDIPFYAIPTAKLDRYLSWRLFIAPFRIISGIIGAYRILHRERINIIFSKGGYVALPVCIAAWLARIPIILHESDTIPGLTNRFVGYFAHRIFTGFLEAMQYFDVKRVECLGQILSPRLFDHRFSDFPRDTIRPHLLVTGGSQGATRLFDVILRHASALYDFDISILLGTCTFDYAERFRPYTYIRTHAFLSGEALAREYYWADCAITRAGATALADLEAFNIRMIIVPLPESGGNHQYHNAENYAWDGHDLVEQSELDEKLETVLMALRDYRKDPTILPPSVTIMNRIETVLCDVADT